MATTRLMPLHTGKGRTVGQAISDILDYSKNPQKTYGHGKNRAFESWGYSVSDSIWLKNEIEKQALEKYLSGD